MLVLACGVCADVEISTYLPFIPCLTILFVIWCWWGLSLSSYARGCGERLAVSPGRYLLVAIFVWIVMVPLTMGSFLVPMLLFLPLWLLSLFFRRPVAPQEGAELSPAARCALEEARIRRVMLRLSVLLVPLSYVVLLVRAWL